MVWDSGTAIFGSVSAEPPIARSDSFRTTNRSRIPRRSQTAGTTAAPFLGTLAIAYVERSGIVITHGERSTHAGVHSPAQQNNRTRFSHGHDPIPVFS